MNKQFIEDVVADFVIQNKSFTAYDITTKLRDDYPSEKWLHYQVKPEVHNLMSDIIDDGEYVREQDFSLHQDGPFVYKPTAKLPVSPIPSNYTNKPTKTQKSNNGQGFSNKVELNFGSRDRLYIHGGLVKKILPNGEREVNTKLLRGLKEISVMAGVNNSNQTYKLDHYFGFKLPKKYVAEVLNITRPIYAYVNIPNDELIITN